MVLVKERIPFGLLNRHAVVANHLERKIVMETKYSLEKVLLYSIQEMIYAKKYTEDRARTISTLFNSCVMLEKDKEKLKECGEKLDELIEQLANHIFSGLMYSEKNQIEEQIKTLAVLTSAAAYSSTYLAD